MQRDRALRALCSGAASRVGASAGMTDMAARALRAETAVKRVLGAEKRRYWRSARTRALTSRAPYARLLLNLYQQP